MKLDASQLTNKILPEAYQCVIMRDVLSVFTKDILEKSLQEVSTILKPGGFFIHLQLRELFTAPAIDFYSNENVIIFPMEVKHEGIYIVDKEEFFKKLDAMESSDPDKSVLLSYAKMYGAEREEFSNLMSLRKDGLNALTYLTSCLKKLNCSSMKKINFNEFFISNTTIALEKAGFEIVKNEMVYNDVIVDRKNAHENTKCHFFSIEKGVRTDSYMGVLALGKVMERAGAHVIVAKKK